MKKIALISVLFLLGILVISSCKKKDTTAPTISLKGDNPMLIAVGSTFTDPGATAVDDVDGDISVAIVASNNVNTAVEGNYTVTYNVSDEEGNKADEVKRTVKVMYF
ncbi:MAG: DUF5011 domain-containing protein [Bacteroidota bacterium]